MKRIAGMVLALGISLPLSGCLVARHPHSSHAVKSAPAKNCKNSQYWDGHQCRHKGKGHGARKHDD